jgi:hypothetical protein
MSKVRILYEDRLLGGNPPEFGPHKLVVRYVCDRLGRNPGELDKAMVSDPKGGNSNVLRACRRDLGRLVKGGCTVIAVYDSDKIGELVGLQRTACKTQIVTLLKEGCAPRERLLVVLLEDNLETVLRAIAEADPTLVSAADLTRAIDRKDRNCRDLILRRAAVAAAGPTRKRVAEKVPSLAYLVDKIVHLLSESTP